MKPAPAAEPLPRAAWVLLTLVAAAVVVALVSFKLFDLDVWQHLLVGKVIWTTRQVPHTQLWTWPTHGEPDVLPSWLFRALLWPFWAVGGIPGLFAWRWVTALAAFGLLWAAVRAMGARGPWALVALVWCAMFFRYRSQPRPETLVAVLVAAQMWVLERRRARGAPGRGLDPAWAVVPIALLWANAHISYYAGLMITTFHWLDAWLVRRKDGVSRRPRVLFMVLLASGAVSFLNPFGWRALWQPFEYFLYWRHEPIYQTIGELAPLNWGMYASSGLPLWLALLGGLAIWRWRRSGPDLVQILTLLVFVPQAISTQRFLGYLAVFAAPAFARDFDAVLERLSARSLRGAWPRTAVAGLLIAALPIASWSDPSVQPGFGLRWNFVPIKACDWIESHGVRGRAMNTFDLGGYLLWRFWPAQDRLPFMDIHQAGTLVDRTLYAMSPQREDAWKKLDAERRFDWVLISRPRVEWNQSADHLDADSSFALVFADDVALLYLRRDGADSSLARREAYRLLPGGTQHLQRAGELAYSSPANARLMRAELMRRLASSPWNSGSHSLLANLELFDGRWGSALAELAAARRLDPDLPMLAEREQMARDSLAASQAR